MLLTHVRSGRLNELARGKRSRVLRLHKRMIHAPEDVRGYAVQGTRPLWKNTNVTAKEIRQVFRCQEAQGRYGAVEATQEV